MTIEDIKKTDLTQNEREVLAADGERWKRMGAGAHLQDWLSFNNGLAIRRRLAMRLAHTNRPVGRGYNEMFSTLNARGWDRHRRQKRDDRVHCGHVAERRT
jgi:hypothetical protein